MQKTKLTLDNIKLCFKLFGEYNGYKMIEGFYSIEAEEVPMLGIQNYVHLIGGGVVNVESSEWDKHYLPLFIQRVIDAINKNNKGDYKITTSDNDIIISHYITNEISKIFSVRAYGIDEARKDTVLYILNKLKEE